MSSLPRFRPLRRSVFPAPMLRLTLVVVPLLAAAAVWPARADSLFHIGPFSFPNPFASPPPGASAPDERPRRSYGAPSGGGTRHRSSAGGSGAKSGGATGGPVYVCVRACDGGFFPMPYTGSPTTLAEVCQALCPNAAVTLFTMPFGGTVDQGVSATGTPYASLPNALKFQQSFEPTCSCQRPGQSWADALAGAEARYGHRSHELVVTAQLAAEMSRPKPDPTAKKANANGADARDTLAAGANALDPELDVNGVDTRLKAAAEAVSRETSGIRDVDDKTGLHFGLKEGQVVQEDDPDGGQRRVRVLAPTL